MAIRRKKKKKPVTAVTPPPEERQRSRNEGGGGEGWFGTPDRLTDPTSQKEGDPQPGLSAPAWSPDAKPKAQLTPAQEFVQALISGDRDRIEAAYSKIGMSDAGAIKSAFTAMPDDQRKLVIGNVQKNKDVFGPMAVGAFETFIKSAPPPPANAKPLNFDPVALEGDEALQAMGMGGGSGSFSRLQASPGRKPDLARVDPRLIEVVSVGASHLPDGYRVTINEGYNASGHTSKSQHKVSGRGAIDVQIWGPDGKAIPNKGADTTGMYGQLARASYGEMKARHPELAGKLAWGGSFGTVSGGSTPDLMHFDIGGERASPGKQFAPVLSQLGPLPGVEYGTAVATAAIPAAPLGAADLDLPAGTDKNSLPAGMRNNNPGNLMYVPGGYLVQGPSSNLDYGTGGAGSGFHQAVYGSALDGMTAAARLAVRKFDAGKTTIREIIAGKGGWTPGYTAGAEGVARAAGLGVDQKLDLHDPAQLQAFLRGLVTQEHGPSSKLYSDALIQAAIARQFGGEVIAVDEGQGAMAGGATSPGASNAIADAIRSAGGRFQKGSRDSAAVEALQASLNNLGARDRFGNPLKVDGTFGNRTKEAVKDYQQKNGLTVDGIVGRQTFGAMNEDFAARQNPEPLDYDPMGLSLSTWSQRAAAPDYGNRQQFARRGQQMVNAGPELIGQGTRDFAAGAAAAAVAVNPAVQRAFVPSGSATIRAALEHPNEDFATERGWDPAAARIAGTLRQLADTQAQIDAAHEFRMAGQPGARAMDFPAPMRADTGVVIPTSFREWLGGEPASEMDLQPAKPQEQERSAFDIEGTLSEPRAQDNGAGSGMFGSDLSRSDSGSSFDSFASGMSAAYQSAASGGSGYGGSPVYSGFTSTPSTTTTPTTTTIPTVSGFPG